MEPDFLPPKSAAITAPVPPPTTNEGITRNGSVAAKGMAPSEILTKPIINEAFPASRSSGVNFF